MISLPPSSSWSGFLIQRGARSSYHPGSQLALWCKTALLPIHISPFILFSFLNILFTRLPLTDWGIESTSWHLCPSVCLTQYNIFCLMIFRKFLRSLYSTPETTFYASRSEVKLNMSNCTPYTTGVAALRCCAIFIWCAKRAFLLLCKKVFLVVVQKGPLSCCAKRAF